jgi:osmotically-inducible protein OsmY
MANDYRDENQNRGMFGYEGEGYMRDEYDRDRGWGRDAGYRGGGYLGGDWPRERSGGFRANDYSDFNRGDYNRPGYGQTSGSDIGPRRQSFRGRGPKNYQRSDDRIREDLCERLSFDDDVDASEIEVQVAGATVTLTGTVHDRREKRRAEDIAESVLGVKDVQNQIRLIRENG